eukprot:gene3705-6594_t
MTDFLYEGYRKRCWKTLRESLEYTEKTNSLVDDLSNNSTSKKPEVQKFHACLLIPLVPKEIRTSFTDCIKRNDGNITKCPRSFENLKRKGLVELNSLVSQDNFGIIKTQAVQNNCELLINKAKKMNCLGKPEQTECSELKQKIFGCVIRTSCTELHKLSNECFERKKSEEEANILSYFFKGQNVDTKLQTEKYCDSVQNNFMSCFEKFFLNALIIHPDHRFKVVLPKSLPLSGLAQAEIIKSDDADWSDVDYTSHYVTDEEGLEDE